MSNSHIVTEIINGYFPNQWYAKGKTAMEAFEAAREIAASQLEREAAAVRACSYERFAHRCIHESVSPSDRWEPMGPNV